MSILAIITARGGSKRIPQKNIKNFCGKPIIEYSIKAAVNAKMFKHVMVSTDDRDIARIAVEKGAEVPFYRSQRNADDFATTADTLIEVLECYKNMGERFDWVCCIYPTAPFITAEKLKNSWEIMNENHANALTPVIKYSYPPQRSFTIENGHLKYIYPQYRNSRSQDLKPIYHDAGQFYYLKTEILLQEKSLLLSNTFPYILDEMEVQDIDNEEDWKIAEMKYQLLSQKI